MLIGAIFLIIGCISILLYWPLIDYHTKETFDLDTVSSKEKIRYVGEVTGISEFGGIYILELDEGIFYIGRTMDIGREFPELKKRKTSYTSGHLPRLHYLEIAASEKAAELREAELRRVLKKNPEQIGVMVLDFHHHMRELGFE